MAHCASAACQAMSDSMAFVVEMTLRTSVAKAKDGLTASQFRRQLCAMAGCLRPDLLSSNSANTAAAAETLAAR